MDDGHCLTFWNYFTPTPKGKTRQSGVTDILSTANAAESPLIYDIFLVNSITNIERATELKDYSNSVERA